MLVVERAAAAAKARLAVAGDVPREADARAEVVRRRVGAVLGNARIAAERFASRRLRESGGMHVVPVVVEREHFDAADLLVPWRRRLQPRAEVQRQPRRESEIVLDEQRSVVHHVILVLARALVEAADDAEEEIGERVAGAARGAAGELKVAGAAELIPDLDGVALQLAAELQVVLALRPRHPVVELDAWTIERRLEVVADVEEVVGVDL